MIGKMEGLQASMTHEEKLTHYFVNKHLLPAEFDAGSGETDQNARKRLGELLKTYDPLAAMEAKIRASYLSDTTIPKSEMRAGLLQGINDMLSMSQRGYFDGKTIQIIERRLASRNLPGLSKLTLRLGKKHAAILKRDMIRNDEEFHMVQEILSDLEFPISANERAKYAMLVVEYEKRER